MTIDELTNRLKQQMNVPQVDEPTGSEPTGKSLRRVRREKAEKYDEMVLQVSSLQSTLARATRHRDNIAYAVEAYFEAKQKLQDANCATPSTHPQEIAILGERVQTTRYQLADLVDDALGGE